MQATETAWVTLGGTLIELLAAIVVGFHVLWAVARILTGHGSDDARLLIARGVLAALSFSVAGTLLKTIALQSWPQIRIFAFVLVLRTLLKQIFQWEQTMIARRLGSRKGFTNSPSTSLILALLIGVLLTSSAVHAATGAHLPNSTLYPRLIRLHHARGALKNSILAKTGNKLFRSLDEGRTFTYLTSVPTASLEAGSPAPDPAANDKERCCSTIYELPRKLGRFPAGTLLYSGSFFSGGTPAIEIYTSADRGAHWQYLSTPLQAGDDHHGLWEPEFTLTKDHALAMFVSDETDPCCSQKLVQMRTRDLLTWSPRQDTVATTFQLAGSQTPATTSQLAGSQTPPGSKYKDRPGMATVSQLPDKTYFMSYEICGPVTHCQVFSRTSRDGWNFGDPTSPGAKVVTTTGQYLAHAPANLFDPSRRQILLVGQVLYESNGAVSPRNGQLRLPNSSPDGSGPWSTEPAPVEVPTAYDNYCPNYSSALMPTANGLLELASDYDAAHRCTSYFATLPQR